jgi:hypothetical protein
MLLSGAWLWVIIICSAIIATWAARGRIRATQGNPQLYRIEFLSERYVDQALITRVIDIEALSETQALACFWTVVSHYIPPANRVQIVKISTR